MTQSSSAIASAPSAFAYESRVRLAVQGTQQSAAARVASGVTAAGERTDSENSRNSEEASASSSSSVSSASSPSGDLFTAQEQQLLAQLKAADRLVRAHEQAHLSAGAGLVRGAASFSMQSGPDNRSYAVAGEVSIDTSPGSTPQETVAKARQIRAAALAPADPSAQDLRVAARASAMEGEAQIELAAQQRALAAASRGSDQQGVLFYRDVAQVADGTPGAALDVYA